MTLLDSLGAFRRSLDALPTHAKGSSAQNQLVQKEARSVLKMLENWVTAFSAAVPWKKLDIEFQAAATQFDAIDAEGGFRRFFGESGTRAHAEKALRLCRPVIEKGTAFHAVVTRVKSCNVFTPLFKEDWKIVFDTNKAPFGGRCSFEDKTIYLSELENDTRLCALLVFELINASFALCFEEVRIKSKSCEAFVQGMAAIEFETARQHHALMIQAAKTDKRWLQCDLWPKEISFEEYQKTAHAESYRAYYNAVLAKKAK